MAKSTNKNGETADENKSLTGGVPTVLGAVLTTQSPPALADNPIVSDTGRELIASDFDRAYWQVDYALQQQVDDAERKHGLDLYEKKMMAEPTMAGIDRALKILTLADGVRVTTAFPAPPRTGATAQQVADYSESQRLQTYVQTCVDRLGENSDDTLFDVCWNLLDACRLGHKLAEVTYNFLPGGEFSGKYGLERIACKPRNNYCFVVDPMNRFRGVIARIPGVSIMTWSGPIANVSQLKNAIAPEKLLNFTLDRTNSDPRGNSWWRNCYDPYYRKQLAKPSEVRALDQAGGQMIYAIAPELKGSVPVTDIDNPTGPQISVMLAVHKAMRRLTSGHHATFPAGTEVFVDRPDGDLKMFDSAFTRYDQEMVRGFLLSARSILEAMHGSKADSDNASDLLDELKMFVREALCSLLNRLSRRLVFMSFGPDMVRYAPIFKMQKASRPDFAANATGLAPLLTAIQAALTEEQWDYFMVEVLGAPAGRVVADISTDPGPDEASQDEGDPAAMAGRFPSEARSAAIYRKRAAFRARRVAAGQR